MPAPKVTHLAGLSSTPRQTESTRLMLHYPVFWFLAVGIMLALAMVLGGLLRTRERRRNVRGFLRDALKGRRREKGTRLR